MEKTTVEPTEIIIKHIPPGTTFQGEPPSVTSANFNIDKAETGSSVSRELFTSDIELLQNLRCRVDSRIALAKAEDILNLGFVLEHDPTPHDHGHTEIRSGKANLTSLGARRKLKKVFKLREEFVVVAVYDDLVRWLEPHEYFEDPESASAKSLTDETGEGTTGTGWIILLIAIGLGYLFYMALSK